MAKETEAADTTLEPSSNNQTRIDYLMMLLDKDAKWVEFIDNHRNKNLSHALVTFAGAYAAVLKFLPDANPWLVSASLTTLALAFFARDFRLHQYAHGWNATLRAHLHSLAKAINEPDDGVSFRMYYRAGEEHALRCSEYFSPTRLAYYVLILGGVMSFFILKFGWVTRG
ncbi:MAG TPA: hypothetical protein VFJ30_06675 [Phycisphaerae bacterium]|nr:hypothetical protein [Phycisphaerae bacterium]